ncbi:major capsid protein [Heyndrickxia ginsengihumi]|uniref:Major capsid protein n=1 Tax=Heyndrickxia ginsengihumi TaxID=363870 RepID=A0A0A6VDW5_9BACI|nr:phage major capsid protein [Heyndrickxia ginsengihumi]KHD85678.1 major capsid protein [Heyndrickxia ginsengihumi]
MGITNLDNKKQAMITAQENLFNAIKQDDEEILNKAMNDFSQVIQDEVLRKARNEFQTELNDQRVIQDRGGDVLTSKELKFYNEVIANGTFEGVETLMPETVINRVFDELVQGHQLLKEIQFVSTGSVTKWIMKNGDVNPAFWGKLTDAIKKKIDNGFKTVNMNLFKLSAYMVVAKSMLDLGPEWLDRYVRTVLVEAMAIALEAAIVAGTGVNQPIGMMKDLDAAHDDTNGYTDKTAIALTDLSPQSLGSKVMKPLTNGGKRTVNNVLIVVNPSDYWEKIFPATTVLNAQGNYVYGVLPIPATIVQSVAVPIGKMVAGLGKNYFLGVGSNEQIVRATEVHIIEDEDVYVTKQYVNGLPQDNISFNVFDISNLLSNTDGETTTESGATTP